MENLNLLYILSIGVYDCSSMLLRILQPQLCDCSLFPEWYNCPSYYHGKLQLSSVNSIASRFEISVSQQARFDNSIVYHSFIFFTQTDYAVFYNSTLFDNSRVSVITSIITFINSSSFSDSEVIVMSDSVKLYEINVFANISSSAIKCYKSNITVSGNALFANNSGAKGAALALYSSNLKLGNGANLTFINNLAIRKGGAIYIEPGLSPFVYASGLNSQMPFCFYELLNCSSTSNYTIHFKNNSAYFGGDDMYGASFHSPHCQYKDDQLCNVTVIGASSNISSVSSDPTRVCLCDSEGMPQCDQLNLTLKVSAGEVFSI